MDRLTDRQIAASTLTATPAASTAEPSAIVSVCVSCKSADGGAAVGADLFAAIKAAVGDTISGVQIRPVQCLSVCKRPATVAVTSRDGYTFLFGDLQTESGAAALIAFVYAYRTAEHGFVPWRERPEILRKAIVARVPPMHWSPDDGRAPT